MEKRHTQDSPVTYCTRAVRQSLWEIELGLEVRGFSVFFFQDGEIYFSP